MQGAVSEPVESSAAYCNPSLSTAGHFSLTLTLLPHHQLDQYETERHTLPPSGQVTLQN